MSQSPYNFACPACGAYGGQSCKDAYGYPIRGFHQPRVNLALGFRRR